ncbi:MAG: SDR family oxidoreductase [Saprospiraceae bacterium]|nr:SDR family oxidoreductase [Saprospiraceae bacterium]
MNVVITGASKGIGKAIAKELAGLSYNLFITSRNEGDLDLLKQELLSINPTIKVYYKSCDVSDRKQIAELAEGILRLFDPVDVLINNAGSFEPGNIVDEPEGRLELLMKTNFESAYHLTRALLPHMIHRQSGFVINMCSIASLQAYPGGSSYGISKFALLGFSKCLREELKNSGIKVTSILPGATWSDSWKGSNEPLERLMMAEDVSKTVAYILSLSPSAVVEEIILRPQLGDL